MADFHCNFSLCFPITKKPIEHWVDVLPIFQSVLSTVGCNECFGVNMPNFPNLVTLDGLWDRLWEIGHIDPKAFIATRSAEHTSELQSPDHLVCRLLLEKKKHKQ